MKYACPYPLWKIFSGMGWSVSGGFD